MRSKTKTKKQIALATFGVVALGLPAIADASATGTVIQIPALDDIGATVVAYLKYGLIIMGAFAIFAASREGLKERSENMSRIIMSAGIAAVGLSVFLFLSNYFNTHSQTQGTAGSTLQQYHLQGFN